MAREQLVKQHAEGVNIAARIQIHSGQPRLFGTHVGRCADELPHCCKKRFIRQTLLGRFGDAEIDHFGHGHPVLHGHQYVRGFEVAMDDALLVGVLDGATDLHKQTNEPLYVRGQVELVAVVGDFDSLSPVPSQKYGPS